MNRLEESTDVSSAPAAQRLSPRVRRLLEEHDVTARAVPGTGAGGRVRATDVLRAAGVPRARSGRLLASPLARRVLRDAGVALDQLVPATPGEPLTRARAERLLAGDGLPTSAGTAPAGVGSPTAVVEVDVTTLLVELSRARALVAGRGPGPGLGAAVAAVVASVLPGGGLPPVALQLPGDGPIVRPLPDAGDCTVAGLARRATETPAVAPDAAAALVVTELAAGPLLAAGARSVLVVGAAAQRSVAGTDANGLPTTSTRYVLELGLHGDSPADGLLGDVTERLEAWTHPVA